MENIYRYKFLFLHVLAIYLEWMGWAKVEAIKIYTKPEKSINYLMTKWKEKKKKLIEI